MTQLGMDLREHGRYQRPPLRDADVVPDERVDEAMELLRGKRDDEGRWPLEYTSPGEVYFEMDDGEGVSSRWKTLRAMRVVRWHEAARGEEVTR